MIKNMWTGYGLATGSSLIILHLKIKRHTVLFLPVMEIDAMGTYNSSKAIYEECFKVRGKEPLVQLDSASNELVHVATRIAQQSWYTSSQLDTIN